MAFRIQDFECEECKKVTEVLLDLQLSDEEQVTCECGCKKMRRILSVKGKGGHPSWGSWSV